MMTENRVFEIVTEYFDKENFTHTELLELERDIVVYNSSAKETSLINRFMNVYDNIIKNKSIYFNENYLIYVTNAVLAHKVEMHIYGNSTYEIAKQFIIEKRSEISHNDITNYNDSCFNISLIKDYENRINKLNRNFVWNNNETIRIHLLTTAWFAINEVNQFYFDTPLVRFLKNSKIFHAISFVYCMTTTIVLNLFIMAYICIKLRGAPDKSELIRLVMYYDSKISNLNYIVYYAALFASSSIINCEIYKYFF